MQFFGGGPGAGRLLGAVAGIALAFPAAAQQVGDATAGRDLAHAVCSTCHNVDPSIDTSENSVPTFAAIARMQSTTELSLQAFLQTPHWPMPNLLLKRDEIGNLTAYILSLRER